MNDYFLIALQFLTIIPVKVKNIDKRKISQSIIFFPVVGLLLGVILIATNRLFCFLNFEQLYINIILVVTLIILTGGIHLDGLADTMDAFLSRADKEGMLKIMQDSRIGVMGSLGLISIILLKIAFLSSIETPLKSIALLLMCTLSRWALILSMFLFPYARQEGKAKVFKKGINFKIFTFATIITLVFVVSMWQFKGLLIFAIIAISTYIIGKVIKDKIGGFTGDTLGAINEIIEVCTLFSIVILQRLIYG